jgi:DivIVA domain-containing protein
VPLTPTDVANKQFRIAFRGYSLDEVDAFLDEVETELTRLLRERSAGGAPAAAPAPAASTTGAGEAAAAAPAPASAVTGMEGQESALRTLLLAQRTADAAIAEAQAEAEALLSKAKGEAERTLSEARAEATSSLEGARTEAESTLGGARAEAEQTLTAARERAAALEAEMAAKVEAATGHLEVRRRQLESRIEELRAFEREYRTRLKAYLETQLRELGSGPGTGDDSGAGVPADARAAAVTSGSFGRRPVEGGAPEPGRPEQAAQPQPVSPPQSASQPTPLRAAPQPQAAPRPELATGPAREPSGPQGPRPVGPFSVVRSVPDIPAEGGADADGPAER